MKYKFIAIPAIGLCLVAAACSTKLDHVPERYLPVYETFSEAPSYRITFPKEDIMDVPSEAVHVIRAPEGADYETGLGWMAVPLADSILVVTQQNTIKSIDSSTGKLLNEYSFVGHGPGEYQFISNLQVTDDHIIIADYSLSIVNIYDHQWNLVDEILLPNLDNRNIDSDIFFWDSRIYYPSGTDKNHIITARNLKNPSDSSVSFHRRVIPLGWEPSRYNQVMMDTSPSGELLVANTMSPFLFLYSNERLNELYFMDLPGLQVLEELSTESDPTGRGIVSGDQTPRFENPPPVPIKRGQASVRTYPIVKNFLHTGDHIIFYYSNWFAKQRFLAVLEKGSDNRWQYRGSYRFYKESGDLFNIGDLSYSEPWLYLSSNFESDILRISIKELIAWPATSIAHNEE